MNNKILFVNNKEISKIINSKINDFHKVELISLINRLNTLSIIKKAGSGHIGTSFSAMDIFVWIKFFQFKTKKKDLNKLYRNIFFSSKGHDVPALYSILYFLKIINLKKISNLRRLNGLDGHPDVSIPGIEANTGSLGIGASKVIYGQYQSLVFRDELTFFQFNTHTPDQIYVININRARYKHSLRPGTLNLHLSASQLNPAYETAGERHEVHLTDDSVTSAGVSQQTALGRQFNIVSGANGIMSGSNLGQVGGSSSYGLFYPDAGIIILNADNFGGQLSASQDPAVSTNINRNHQLLRNVMSGSVGGGGTDDPAGDVFILDSEEKVTSQYYFVRAKNLEYNYTSNPSFVDTTGALNFDSMIDNPTVYITTVGLFNNAGDMVAVAKLSQPVTKDFTKEALIRVKLDY